MVIKKRQDFSRFSSARRFQKFVFNFFNFSYEKVYLILYNLLLISMEASSYLCTFTKDVMPLITNDHYEIKRSIEDNVKNLCVCLIIIIFGRNQKIRQMVKNKLDDLDSKKWADWEIGFRGEEWTFYEKHLIRFFFFSVWMTFFHLLM